VAGVWREKGEKGRKGNGERWGGGEICALGQGF